MSLASPRRRRRGRWVVLLACGAVLALAAVFHAGLLTAAARLLVVDQADRPVTHLVVLGGDSRHDVAAAFLRQNPAGRILLIEAVPDTLVEHGIVPSAEALDRRALAERGVPDLAVETLGEPAGNAWQAMRRLDGWLDAHADAQVGVLCDRFASRYHRAVIDAVLPPQAAARVNLWALPHHEYDETNWWRRRTSARQFVYAWLHLAYQLFGGEPPPRPRRWNPDEYEATLRGQQSAVGDRRSEIGDRQSEVGDRKSEIGSRRSEVGDRKSEIGGRKSEVGGRKSEVGDRRSEVDIQRSTFPYPLPL